MTPSTLAEIFRTTRGNISHCLSHLEKKGFISRLLDRSDARKYRLLLTPEGKKLALKLMKMIDGFEDLFEKRIGKQKVTSLIEVLRELSETKQPPSNYYTS